MTIRQTLVLLTFLGVIFLAGCGIHLNVYQCVEKTLTPEEMAKQLQEDLGSGVGASVEIKDLTGDGTLDVYIMVSGKLESVGRFLLKVGSEVGCLGRQSWKLGKVRVDVDQDSYEAAVEDLTKCSDSTKRGGDPFRCQERAWTKQSFQ